MEYKDYIDNIVEKYNYPDNIRKAIEIVLPLMVRKYGKNRFNDILMVFDKVRIFTIKEQTEEEYDRIEDLMTSDINKHVLEEEIADYGRDSIPASIYSYQTIYDEDMNPIGERKWIVVEEVPNYRKEGFENTFGTNINVPLFIHELGHALGMLNPTYEKDGNIIRSKHGMYEVVNEVKKEENSYLVISLEQKNLLVEESINEKHTQDMLKDFFNESDYNKVRERLREMRFIPSSYGPTMVSVAEFLETHLGKENLAKWRIDNDLKIKDNFNEISRPTQIAKKYFAGEEAFDFVARNIQQIFFNNCDSYKMRVEEYKYKNLVAFMDALAPICAYREGIGEKDFSFYDEHRQKVLPEENKTELPDKKAF